MRRISIVLVLAALAMTGCVSKATRDQPAKAVEPDAAKEAIIKLMQQWETTFRNKDATALANLCTDDCVSMGSGPTRIGRRELEATAREVFAAIWNTKFDTSIKTDEVVVSGEYGFARGTLTLTQEIDGETTTKSDKWMATYKRQPDGTWKVYWLTSNSNE